MHQDLTHALAWAERPGQAEVALQRAPTRPFWVLQAYREAVTELDRALAGAGGDSRRPPQARWALAYVRLFAGDHEAARREAEEAADAARRPRTCTAARAST